MPGGNILRGERRCSVRFGRTQRVLSALPGRYDHHHDHAPLQYLLRHGHRSVPRPVFDVFRLWTATTQRTLPARHGAAEHRRLFCKHPTMPTRGMRVPDEHHHHHDLALQRSRSALRHMRYGDVQGKLRPWPDAGVYGSGYRHTMQLSHQLWDSGCPGLRLNHGERVPNECVLSPAVSVGTRRLRALPLRSAAILASDAPRNLVRS